MNGLLAGKVALITGGSRGLGRALTSVFAREGARVAFNYLRDDEAAARTQALVEERGSLALAFKVSVLDSAGLRGMTAEIQARFGPIDILVNNASVTQIMPFALMEQTDWDLVLDTNVKGVYLVTRAVLPSMIARKQGKIINVSSLAGVHLIRAPVHYATSKAAIQGFTRALSKEMARYNIHVNCLAPGLLDQGVSAAVPEDLKAKYLEHCSLGRLGTPLEVAELAAFVASERCSYLSGETIVIDGGV